MNNYCCPSCGSELREQSKFCPNCGLGIAQTQQEEAKQDPAPDLAQQQNTYNPGHALWRKAQNPPKFNYILFIFITSLIFLLHFISRTFDMMISTLTWESFGSVFRLMITLAVFIIAITHFAAAVNSIYKLNPIKKRADSARKLFGLSIAMATLSTMLLFFDYIIIFGVYLPFYRRVYPDMFYNGNLINMFMKQFISILIGDIFFVIFAFITMSKANRFKIEIVNYAQNLK